MSLTLDAPDTVRIQTTQPRREMPRCYCNGAGWAVAHTHPQAETWADSNLRLRGYQTILPLYAVRIRDRVLPTMTRIVMRPLFTSYIFVLHDRGSSWRPIYETPGVASVLKNGSQLQYALECDIRALQATEDARRCPVAENASIGPGDAVVPVAGVFKDHEAVVTEVHGSHATIGLMMFGHLRQVSVPLAALVARA